MAAFGGKTALITGGASGIGRALAIELGRRGARVVLADVNVPGLRDVAREVGTDAETATLDVTDAAAVRRVVEDVASRHGLDFMFNNAGIAIAGEVHEMTLDHFRRTLEVNLHGVVHGTLAAYEVMRERGTGHIVNTASVAGLVPSPGLAAYCASKHGVVGLSTSLRVEAEAFGVKVSAVCPGVIDTPMARMPELASTSRTVFERLREHMPVEPYPPEACARDVLRGVERNDALIVVTRHGKVMASLQRAAPAVFRQFMRRQLEKSRRLRAELAS